MCLQWRMKASLSKGSARFFLAALLSCVLPLVRKESDIYKKKNIDICQMKNCLYFYVNVYVCVCVCVK